MDCVIFFRRVFFSFFSGPVVYSWTQMSLEVKAAHISSSVILTSRPVESALYVCKGSARRSRRVFVQIWDSLPLVLFFCDVRRYFPLVMVSWIAELCSFSSSSQQDCELFIGILAALHSTRLKDKNWRNLSDTLALILSAPLQHMLL